LDDRPILSGKHPQHLYLGALGAEALYRQSRTCVYDPGFQAGYPKTPIFDGCRLAEVFLFAGGGTYQPAAYKVGVVGVCLLVPLLLLLACGATGLVGLSTLLATAVGM